MAPDKAGATFFINWHSLGYRNYMNSALQHTISQYLCMYTKHYYPFQVIPVKGGSINETYGIQYGRDKFFCKINDRDTLPDLFRKEAKGLEYISMTKKIRVPAVIDVLYTETHQILLMEWIDTTTPTVLSWEKLALQLAGLHNCTFPNFGWFEDNYMGNMEQRNQQMSTWPNFFIECRLVPQMKIGYDQDLLQKKDLLALQRLFNRLPDIYPPTQPQLVHGDLWHGNILFDLKGNPVLIDPAIHYGHAAADLGLTQLFGGVDTRFYDVYISEADLAPNYREQWEIANLYPLLMHLNLFGKSYYSGIADTIHSFV